MNTTSRRSFVSNALKVTALAALPEITSKSLPYTLTVNDGAFGAVLARVTFSGDVVPVDPRTYLPFAKRNWVSAFVSGLPDGTEMVCEHFKEEDVELRNYGLNFKLWEPVRVTKRDRRVEMQMLRRKRSATGWWAHSRYVFFNGEIIEKVWWDILPSSAVATVG